MNQEKFGDMIKKIRREKNLTQRELAEKLGVTYQAVSKWETGKNLPDIAIIKQIAEEFSIDLSILFDVNLKKRHNKYFVLGIIISLLLVSSILCIYFCTDKGFNFKEISTTCSSFKLYGSIAYNKEKSSIYISNISYCGEEDTTIYQSITSTFYEKEEEGKRIISQGEEKKDLSLNEYLKDINFRVDDFVPNCKSYKDNHFYIEIIGNYERNKKIVYEIPLNFNDNCLN